MIVRDFPRLAIWLMNLTVIGALVIFGYSLKWAGTEFCVGLIAGFAWCYIQFRCWRYDYDETANSEVQPRQPLPPR